MRNTLLSFDGFTLFSAPVFAGLAGLAAFLFLNAHKREAGLSEEDFWDLVLALVAAVLGGAVLSYLFIYKGGALHNLGVIAAKKRLPGGSIWGVLWGAVLAAWACCRLKKIDFRPVADALGLSAILGLAVMRVGCFLHGCCHGAPSGLPWAVTFTDPRCAVRKSLLGVPLHPAQLYEMLGCLAIFLGVHYGGYRAGKLKPGGAFTLSILLYCALRFAVDFARLRDGGAIDTAYLGTGQIMALATAAGVAIWHELK